MTAKWEKLDEQDFTKYAYSTRFVILITIAPCHKMQEAASHDYARQLHFAHPQLPSQQLLMLVAPTTHQAAKDVTI